jgi:hypothetical protein
LNGQLSSSSGIPSPSESPEIVVVVVGIVVVKQYLIIFINYSNLSLIYER